MYDNKQLYKIAQEVGLDRQAIIKRAERAGMTPPLDENQFKKIIGDLSQSSRISDETRQGLAALQGDKVHAPFFRQSSPTPSQTVSQPVLPSSQSVSPSSKTVLDETEFVLDENETEDLVLDEPRREVRPPQKSSQPPSQPVSPKPSSSQPSHKLTYADAMGSSIRGITTFIWALTIISAIGISFMLYNFGAGFVSNPWMKVGVGGLAVFVAWKWEKALADIRNTWWHQVQYRLFDGWVSGIVTTGALVILMAPNVYQSYMASNSLANHAAPPHIQQDGTRLNQDETKELVAIAADYERQRQTLSQERETAALANAEVNKLSIYQQAEERTAAARRGEATKYFNKGERANGNWCLTLAKRAEAKAREWRIKKEHASAGVIATYASRFTEIDQAEEAAKNQARGKYQGLVVQHQTKEQQLRSASLSMNKGISMIGLILLPIADIVIFLLSYLVVNYYYKTNQIDPSLKPYRVGEKTKTEEFIQDVLGPAWEVVFNRIRRVGYNYKAIAVAASQRAEYVQKLNGEIAKVKHQQYERKIEERIALLRGA